MQAKPVGFLWQHQPQKQPGLSVTLGSKPEKPAEHERCRGRRRVGRIRRNQRNDGTCRNATGYHARGGEGTGPGVSPWQQVLEVGGAWPGVDQCTMVRGVVQRSMWAPLLLLVLPSSSTATNSTEGRGRCMYREGRPGFLCDSGQCIERGEVGGSRGRETLQKMSSII